MLVSKFKDEIESLRKNNDIKWLQQICSVIDSVLAEYELISHTTKQKSLFSEIINDCKECKEVINETIIHVKKQLYDTGTD